jgi:hypothetical protein
MQSENEAKLRKLAQVSSFLQGICKVVLSFYIVMLLVMLWGMLGGPGHDFMGANFVNFHIHDLGAKDRLVVGGLFAATGGVMFLAVFQIHQLLGNCGRGELFTRESAGHVRRWGLACVVWGFLKFLWLGVPYFIGAIHLVPNGGTAEFEAIANDCEWINSCGVLMVYGDGRGAA